jgi:hypothetical protein
MKFKSFVTGLVMSVLTNAGIVDVADIAKIM